VLLDHAGEIDHREPARLAVDQAVHRDGLDVEEAAVRPDAELGDPPVVATAHRSRERA